MSALENPSDAQSMYLWPEPLLRHTKLAIGPLSVLKQVQGKPVTDASQN